MYKYLSLMGLCMVMHYVAIAQNLKFGIYGGLNSSIPSLGVRQSPAGSFHTPMGLGEQIGLDLEYAPHHFGIGTGIEACNTTYNLLPLAVGNDEVVSVISARYGLGMLSVPLYASYNRNMGKNLALYFKVGLSYNSYSFSSMRMSTFDYNMSGSTSMVANNSTDLDGRYKSWGIMAEAGIRPLEKLSRFSLSLEWRYTNASTRPQLIGIAYSHNGSIEQKLSDEQFRPVYTGFNIQYQLRFRKKA